MTAALDKIMEALIHQTYQPIVGQPYYEYISEFHLKLNINAASVHSHTGNGLLG